MAEQADGLGQVALAQQQVEQHRHRRRVVAERLRVGAERRVHVVLLAGAAHRLGIAILLKAATAARLLGDATATATLAKPPTALLAAHLRGLWIHARHDARPTQQWVASA